MNVLGMQNQNAALPKNTRGFLISCVTYKERLAAQEAINLLTEVCRLFVSSLSTCIDSIYVQLTTLPELYYSCSAKQEVSGGQRRRLPLGAVCFDTTLHHLIPLYLLRGLKYCTTLQWTLPD